MSTTRFGYVTFESTSPRLPANVQYEYNDVLINFETHYGNDQEKMIKSVEKHKATDGNERCIRRNTSEG